MNLQKYKQQVENEEVINWIDTVLKNYLADETNEENVGEIEHILDYFEFRIKDLKRRFKVFRAKKLSYVDAVRLSQEWVKANNKKAADIVEVEADVEEVLKLENGLRLVKLVGENAYKREGVLMSHCVGSYHGKSVDVYSIRDGKNMPHCTIEVNTENINQIKGKGNGSVHPKYIGSVLKALKHFKLEIRKSELVHLGYREIGEDLFNFYNNKVENFKYINYLGSVFMYVNQKFKIRDGEAA